MSNGDRSALDPLQFWVLLCFMFFLRDWWCSYHGLGVWTRQCWQGEAVSFIGMHIAGKSRSSFNAHEPFFRSCL